MNAWGLSTTSLPQPVCRSKQCQAEACHKPKIRAVVAESVVQALVAHVLR